MTPVTPRIQWTPQGKPRITNGVQVLLYVSRLPFHEQALNLDDTEATDDHRPD